jgi:Asp-tRNA(Asn)/Glu-tRNA(Gln) amidotransferase A subunit family amidase
LRDYRPSRDATAVTRIRQAGAVIFGKTNLPAVANFPATAIPTRHLLADYPGVQVVCPYLGDRTTRKFAQLLERELGGFIPPPELSLAA